MGLNLNIRKTNLGYEFKTDHLVCLFGGTESQLPNLKKSYPDFEFIRVKQTHSDVIVESSDISLDYQVIADSHYTTKTNTALCVATADCVPILISHQESGYIAAIHAGWRGVANQILMKTIERLGQLGLRPDSLNVFIGPHIQVESFQVEKDVRDQILTSLNPSNSLDLNDYYQELPNGKFLVDLNLITKSQLLHMGVSKEKIINLHIDTVSELDFHSHRRDKEKAGRQLSFICNKIRS